MHESSVKKLIKKTASSITSVLENTVEQTQSKQRQLLALQEQKVDAYQRMASIYLLEAPQTDDIQKVQALMQKLKDELSLLEKRIQSLGKSILFHQNEQNNQEEKIGEKEQERDQILKADISFCKLMDTLTDAQEKHQYIEESHDLALKEFGAKLQQYSKDARYNYLIKRNFSTPAYKGSGIFRHLDGWVARQVNFDLNYKNQQTLEALIKESNKRYSSSKKLCQSLFEKKNKKILAVEKQIGLTALYKQQQITETALANAQRDQDEAAHDLNQTRDGQGSRFAKIAEQVAVVMNNLSSEKLKEMVLKTQSKEDDQLFNQLTKLEDGILTHQQQISQLQKTYSNLKNAHSKVVSVYKFQKNNGREYEYSTSSSALQDMLDEVARGSRSPTSVIAHLSNVSSVVPPRSYSSSSGSSSSSSSWGSSSSSSSGGFSSSSSSGGGGFRTTDSF